MKKQKNDPALTAIKDVLTSSKVKGIEKSKKYLSVTATRHDGSSFYNPLQLKEAYLLSQMAQENRFLFVMCEEVPVSRYNIIFGKR